MSFCLSISSSLSPCVPVVLFVASDTPIRPFADRTRPPCAPITFGVMRSVSCEIWTDCIICTASCRRKRPSLLYTSSPSSRSLVLTLASSPATTGLPSSTPAHTSDVRHYQPDARPNRISVSVYPILCEVQLDSQGVLVSAGAIADIHVKGFHFRRIAHQLSCSQTFVYPRHLPGPCEEVPKLGLGPRVGPS